MAFDSSAASSSCSIAIATHFMGGLRRSRGRGRVGGLGELATGLSSSFSIFLYKEEKPAFISAPKLSKFSII
ncbi:unnamed protein product [Cuscuta campestris]|uniref:Uncharacterized protein n=1 Tax=Cuscuta campestris TaxID=132261 RepID=A0A484KVZ7_9ASTE|nr:unnamed protein product [Cuscuta campestris]